MLKRKWQEYEAPSEDEVESGAFVSASNRASLLSQQQQPNVSRRTQEYNVPSEGLEATLSASEQVSSREPSHQPQRNGSRRTFSHVQIPGISVAKSIFKGWQPPLPPVDERSALDDLLDSSAASQDDTEYTFIELNEFTLYRQNPRREYCLETLDLLNTTNCHKATLDTLYFSGILSSGNHELERFVQDVPFGVVTIDSYDDRSNADIRGQICIRSALAGRRDVWYRLGKPAQEYRRFFDSFVWLATFGKFFLEYLMDHTAVTLRSFQSDFFAWLVRSYVGTKAFQSWHAQCGLGDFRTTVAAHVHYLWKECCGLDDGALREQPIWGEVREMTAIPCQQLEEERTVVTPYVYECFKHMYFADQLQARTPASKVEAGIIERKTALGLTTCTKTQAVSGRPPSGSVSSGFSRGDFVMINKDADGRQWQKSRDLWYAYVQDIRETKEGTKLDLLWLYHPADTTIGQAFYPFDNELFLSDNCNCGKDAFDVDQVVGKVHITMDNINPYETADLFVRQKFRTVPEDDQHDFVTIQPSDFTCQCRRHKSVFEHCVENYRDGDTVLVLENQRDEQDDSENSILEVAQIINFDHPKQRVIIRRFDRRRAYDDEALPNELQSTFGTSDKAPSKIVRKCHVCRFPTRGDVCIPPYDRGGAGDYYFVLDEFEPKAAMTFSLLDEYEDHSHTPRVQRPLRGLGMFCGGGNFDRGLEEGGAVEFDYAIDFAPAALHTYKANAGSHVNFFLGSVDDYLARTLKGCARSGDKRLASIGAAELISAGSPCPGFSMMQSNKLSGESKKNASLVASVVSFVDTYSPYYLVLENVPAMATWMGPQKDQNVFAQVLAALVGLGYQTQQFLMDAWSYGSPQQRTRLMIVASAPGLQPWPAPAHTHDHATGQCSNRALGKMSNGLSFGVRKDHVTPFAHVSAREAADDLPDIGDSSVQICPRFPDHRIAQVKNNYARQRVARVPVHPRGMGLVQAIAQGYIKSGEALEYIQRSSSFRGNPNSRSHSRITPNGLLPTILTELGFDDAKNGRFLHWDQHRGLTNQEARRAQGFPDDEVIVGTAVQQLKVIGNSVDRKVSFALGLVLADSWSGSLDFQRHQGYHLAQRAPALMPEATLPIHAAQSPDVMSISSDDASEEITVVYPSAARIDSGSTLQPEQIQAIRQHGLEALRTIVADGELGFLSSDQETVGLTASA